MATPEAAIRLVISADNLAGPAIDGLNKALASIAKSLERITGTGKGAAGELAKVGDESGPADALAKALAKADRALAGISGEGKAADTALAKMGASADKAATGVAKVDESIAKIKTESGAADSGLSKMSGELDRVAAAGDRTAAALDKEALAAAKAGGAGLAGGAEAAAGTAATGGGVGTEAQAAAAGAAAGGAGGAGGAVAETAANAEIATKRWEKVGKAAESASRFFLTVGAAAGIAGVGAVILGSKFQQAMELIHTQAGATQAEANRMSRAILAMGGTVSQGPMQLADALYHLESVGLRGSKALDALKAAAEGAAIGGASLNDTTYALSSAVNTGIQGTQNFNEAMGMLVAIAGSGDMHMQDLAQSLSSGVLPAGKAAGLSLLDVGAALATLTDNGVPAQEAATRLRMTFSLLSAPTKQATKELASIGMSQLQLAQDMRQHGLLFALEDLKRHLTDTGLTAEQQGEIIARSFGGGKSSATIITLLDSLGRLQSKYKIIGKGAKDFGSDWAATQKTTAVAWGKMMSSLESMGIELGQKLMPVATRVMDAITRLAAAFGKLPPGTIKAIAGAIVGLTAVLLPLGAALFVFSKVAQLAAAMEAFGVATGIALGPIALIGIALVALGVIVLEVITHWKQITDWMRKNVPGAFKVATEVVRVLGATFHTAFTAIARLISRVWIEVQSWTKQHWSEIEAVLRVVFDVLKTLITVQFDLYAGIVKGAWNGIKLTTQGVWDIIRGTIKLAVDIVTGVLGVFFDLVTGHWSQAWTDFRDLVRNVWNDIRTIITGAIDAIKGPLEAITGAIGGLISGAQKAAAAVGSVASSTTATHSTVKKGVKVPKLADGGIVSAPTLALVGESGPEAVIPLGANPLNTGAIGPLNAGAVGAGSIVINITGVAADPRTLAQMVATEINRTVKRTTRGAWAT